MVLNITRRHAAVVKAVVFIYVIFYLYHSGYPIYYLSYINSKMYPVILSNDTISSKV